MKLKVGLGEVTEEHNGVLVGLTKFICRECGKRILQVSSLPELTRCPSCGNKEIIKIVGNRPLRKKPGAFQSPNLGQQSYRIKLNGGKTMVDEKAKKVASLIVELKNLGCDVNLDDINTDNAVTKTEMVDETKGEVGEVLDLAGDKAASVSEHTVLEIAESGKGFAVFADYTKLDSNKFKRLTR